MARRDFIEQYAKGEFDAATVSNMQDAFEDAWLRMAKPEDSSWQTASVTRLGQGIGRCCSPQ
jgi:hypothetical protein